MVIEWGDGFVERLADEFLEIQMSFGDGDDDRLITVNPHGARWQGFSL